MLAIDAVRDPHGFFANLRDYDPVFWSERHRGYILTSFEQVSNAFRDPALSAAAPMKGFRQRLGEERRQAMARALSLLDGWMLMNDPPEHTRLREPVRRSFGPQVARALVPKIEAQVDRLLDSLEDGDDLVEAFAHPLPAMVICDLLGVEEQDRAFLGDWTKDFAKLIYGASSKDEGYVDIVSRAGNAFHEKLTPLIRKRMANPDDTLLSRLIETSGDEEWTEAELLGACSMLLFAGHDTTAIFIASAAHVLMGDPGAKRRFLDEPAIRDSAIEELLRVEGPSKTFPRVALETHERGGHVIKAGAPLWLAVLGANHDPETFTDPDTLNLGRDPNPHIGFGGGIHFCAGATLARTEAKIAIQRLLERFPDLSPASDNVTWNRAVIDRSLTALPVRLS